MHTYIAAASSSLPHKTFIHFYAFIWAIFIFWCAVRSICFCFYCRLRPILSLVCSRFHFPVGASASMRPACNLYAMLPFRSYYFFFFTFVYPTRHTTYFIPFTIPILPALRMKAFYLAKNKSVKSECLNRWYRRRWWLRSNSSCVAFYSMHSIWQWRWQSGNYFMERI